jgi:predicted membrane-bound spermidine synthase
MLWLYVIFVASGFAALLYEVVWQRAFFAIYGVNIESVTVIVTAFMLGLGIGSLLGGAVSKDPKRPALLIFSGVELTIGLYGLLSLSIFRWVGSLTLGASAVATFFLVFALVLVPTVMMGGTLPLLVAHAVRRSGSVGRSVSVLYFVNTLGSAIASAAAVFLLLGNLGLRRTVEVAAAINLSVSALAWVQHMRERRVRAAVTTGNPVSS